ncbi:MAG: 3-hydroxyacyl-CoA dehydrogenase family protein [Streptosporangiales bacterium]
MGLSPIRLHRDTPGFVINRLQFALLREAAELVDSGVVDPEGVDLLVSEGLGPRWAAAGPFATVALGGSELFEQLTHRLYPYLSRDTAPAGPVAKREFSPDSIADLGRQRTDRLRAVLERAHQGSDRTERSGW